MKERPILFNGPMVRSILEGRKTQTRRVVKWNIKHDEDDGAVCLELHDGWWPYAFYDGNETPLSSPYGQPGDRLWVRETWRVGAWNEDQGQIAVDYRADVFVRDEWLDVPEFDSRGEEWFARLWLESTDDADNAGYKLVYDDRTPDGEYRWKPGESPCRWRPSIHMPRWASRILLEVVRVRVERVQEISEDDARAEGVYPVASSSIAEIARETHIPPFRYLWDSTNLKRGYGWDANPWVWVVEFKRVEG